MKIQVNSEIGKLKAAMMQRPGKEITRLTPLNMKSLLWDNVPWPGRAAEEHQAYVETLKNLGIKVYIMSDLLKDVLKDDTLRKELITESIAYESRRLSLQTLVQHKNPGPQGQVRVQWLCHLNGPMLHLT